MRTRLPDSLVGPMAVAALASPFLALAALGMADGYLSDAHAHLLAKALLVRDRGRVELLGFLFPPLPFLMLIPTPSVLVVHLIAAFSAAGTLWLLWRQLEQIPWLGTCLRLALLLSVVGLPMWLFLATQSAADMLALYLFTLAWTYYLQFTRHGSTWAGFISGLILGLTFFTSYYAMLLVLPYAAFVPAFAREKKPAYLLAGSVILLFPLLLAFVSWTYLSWLFVGRPLEFLLDYRSSLYVSGLTPAALAYWSPEPAVWREMVAVPVYLVVGLLTLRARPERILVYLSPALLLLLGEWVGVRHPPHFAVGIFATMALAAIPRRRPGRGMAAILVLAAALQLAVGYSRPGLLAIQHSWWQDLWTPGPEPATLVEMRAAEAFRQAATRSVLANEVTAYRLIARTGTARPFLLPSDDLFDLAEEQPADHVPYVLVAVEASAYTDPLAARYAQRPPRGFLLDAAFDGWRLYRRQDAVSLMGDPLLVP